MADAAQSDEPRQHRALVFGVEVVVDVAFALAVALGVAVALAVVVVFALAVSARSGWWTAGLAAPARPRNIARRWVCRSPTSSPSGPHPVRPSG